MPNSKNRLPLCHIDDLSDPGAKGFSLKLGRKERLIFMIKKAGQVYAYENQCPHTGVNLEWQEDDFLNLEKTHIVCSVHGAIFGLQKGECLGGPCNGSGLSAITIEVDEAGNVWLK